MSEPASIPLELDHRYSAENSHQQNEPDAENVPSESSASHTYTNHQQHSTPSSISRISHENPTAVKQDPDHASSTSSRSQGPSKLEQVVSKTRPSHLPPKAKAEDLKHLIDWETMMRHSRQIDEARRTALREKQAAREARIESQLSVWEKAILPDWRVIYNSQKLKGLWWQGVPSKLRSHLWPQVIGNQLAISRGTYKICLARAKKSISAGNYPAHLLINIEQDIESTLPSLKLFSTCSGPLYSDLRDMLLAWTVSRTDEGLEPYSQGAARIAAMFQINLASIDQAFIAFRNFIERNCIRAFYGGSASLDEREAYYRIFDTLLADYMPKVYFNFKQHQISPAVYLPEWLATVFLDHLPFDICARIWDVVALEGDSFLFRVAIGILATLAGRLYFPDRQELLDVLRGVHPAATEVARRTDSDLENGKYSIYGLNEESLWQCIEEVEIWWKDSTWTRLVQRELPDI